MVNVERLSVLREVLSGNLSADRNLAGRLENWGYLFEVFSTSPLIGVGPVIRLREVPDNQYLWVLVRFGVLGLGAYLLLLGSVVRGGIRTLKMVHGNDYFVVLGVLAGLCGLMVQALAVEIFSTPRTAELHWIAFGIIEGTATKHLRERTGVAVALQEERS